MTDAPAVDQVLARYVSAQAYALRRHAGGVRSETPDAVHRTRVAMRRLRSVLATYRPVLDRSISDPLRDDVRRLAAELGPARDLEVLGEHLLSCLEEEAAREAVSAWLETRVGVARARAAIAVESERFGDVCDRLADFVDRPPVEVGGDAYDLVGGLLGKEWRRLAKAVGTSLAAPPGERDPFLHEARKAAKRLRYAAESATPVLGGRARRLAKRAEAVQTDLGTHQDAVVARAAIRRIAADADPEVAFALGRLHGLEQWRAYRADRAFARRWARESTRYPKRWMRSGR